LLILKYQSYFKKQVTLTLKYRGFHANRNKVIFGRIQKIAKKIQMEQVRSVISLYTESTPNPATMKFVVNRILLKGLTADYTSINDTEGAPFAAALFGFNYVTGVFIKNNFVTLAKTEDKNWQEVIPEIREFIRGYLSEEKTVFTNSALAEIKEKSSVKTDGQSEIEQQIVELIQTYVQPAVEMDGGSIVFKSFDEGVVTLGMQGACSGCPSSTITLKNGIQGLLERMLPEGTVKDVVAQEM